MVDENVEAVARAIHDAWYAPGFSFGWENRPAGYFENLAKAAISALSAAPANVATRSGQQVDVDPRTESFPHCYIGRFTFAEWEEFAKRDDCLIDMVPSELRAILDFGRGMQACAKYWCDEISEDKRESNKLRAHLSALTPIPSEEVKREGDTRP